MIPSYALDIYQLKGPTLILALTFDVARKQNPLPGWIECAAALGLSHCGEFRRLESYLLPGRSAVHNINRQVTHSCF
jgi:hypothetical protein